MSWSSRQRFVKYIVTIADSPNQTPETINALMALSNMFLGMARDNNISIDLVEYISTLQDKANGKANNDMEKLTRDSLMQHLNPLIDSSADKVKVVNPQNTPPDAIMSREEQIKFAKSILSAIDSVDHMTPDLAYTFRQLGNKFTRMSDSSNLSLALSEYLRIVYDVSSETQQNISTWIQEFRQVVENNLS